jgi:hypothetical protein
MVPPRPSADSRERRRLSAGRLAVFTGLLALPVVLGCTSAKYDADHAKAVAEFRTRAEFSRLQESPADLAEGRVRLHPPKELPDLLSEIAADPRFPAGEDGEVRKVPPRRLRPPFLEGFAGWAAAYEGVHGANAKLPAALSINLVPTAEMNEAQIQIDLLARIKKEEAFEGAKPEWQSREVTDRAGATRTWRVLEMHGPQRVDRFAGRNEPVEESLESSVAVWLSAERGQEFCTVLAWRVPDEIKESVKLDVLAPLVARSLSTAAAAK